MQTHGRLFPIDEGRKRPPAPAPRIFIYTWRYAEAKIATAAGTANLLRKKTSPFWFRAANRTAARAAKRKRAKGTGGGPE